MNARRKPSKYRNVRTEYNGRLYDSKAEAERAVVLDLLKTSDLIRDWQPQVTFQLGCPENRYRVDFLVWLPDGTTQAEDVKGVDTASFKRNVRLWRKYGPCPLHVIYRRGTEVITPDRLITSEEPQP